MSDLGADFIRRVNKKPLPVDLFMDLLAVAVSALRGERREIPPDAERCLEDLPPNTLYVTDNNQNQMAFSVISTCKSRFPEDQEEAEDTSFSFMFRWFAIQKAKHAGTLQEFAEPGDEPHTEMIHTAVFAVAADCPLDCKDGSFDQSFIPRIRQLIEREHGP
ncbi:MAG: hypothetical protein ABSH08_07650 [Tepidisphaeraceae bacterium]|jgi:hypothetical protein